MNRSAVVLLLAICACSKSPKTEVPKASLETDFDPTGTYDLIADTTMSEGERFGYAGQIRVILMAPTQVAIGFGIDKGAPSYNSGGFVDTLDYLNHIAVYKCPEFDSTCAITLTFTKDGIQSSEQTDDFNSGCGFGHAVVANGYFRKTSSTRPVQLDPNEPDE